mmetsp:Transcript_19524/g.28274  ORF Transcript_19524/g.28274 Transcript_19524/m.28274 type:complete len:200 (-) Transcript_19524:1304-1903(-)
MLRQFFFGLLYLFQLSQATVLIFWTDSDGVTNCEVRHDLDDCGFANVNPSVDCFPWFSMTGSGNTGSVVVNNEIVSPAIRKEEYLYDDISLPDKTKPDVEYDSYLVRESSLLRGGSKVVIAIIGKESSPTAVTRLASAGCDGRFKVVSIPSSKKTDDKGRKIVFSGTSASGGTTITAKETTITQQYGEILIDGVIFEVE